MLAHSHLMSHVGPQTNSVPIAIRFHLKPFLSMVPSLGKLAPSPPHATYCIQKRRNRLTGLLFNVLTFEMLVKRPLVEWQAAKVSSC